MGMAKFGCPPKFKALIRKLRDDMLARVQNDGEFGCPPKFIAMILQLHDDMLARVQNDGELAVHQSS